MKYLIIILLFLIGLSNGQVIAQISNGGGAELDSLRKQEESEEDSVVFTSKFIRYTTLNLLKDSTQTIPIDTTSTNFHNYSPINQPTNPTIGLGNIGLAYRELLFNPTKTIGFDAGFHALDAYLLKPSDIKYYRARTPFTELYYINGTLKEQVFKVIHSQNIKPGFNIGANYNRIGSEGFYINQKADHLNAAVFSWYESPNKRYNVLANGVFNTLKAAENGAVIEENVFQAQFGNVIPVRLAATGSDNRSQQTWRQSGFFLKQFYYIGRIDSLVKDGVSTKILPTQRVSYAISYNKDRYKYFRNEKDEKQALSSNLEDVTLITNDSTEVRNIRNEFNYSFYLRGKAATFIKNEVKLDLGAQHDYYNYKQSIYNNSVNYKNSFQNITLKAGIGYRFSDRITIEGDLQQIGQGRNAGDYLYDAKTNIRLSKSVGRIVLGAYIQNKSPEQLYERSNYQYQNWEKSFNKTKINNLSFLYENPKFKFFAKADYYLVNNYLFYRETSTSKEIEPAQFGTNINLLKITAAKHFILGKFNLESYVVYQKTDFQDILRTPEVYAHTNFYYGSRLFKVLYTNIGVDARYNTPMKAPAYAINTGQFYNDNNSEKFDRYPIVDVYVKATLKRANLFIKYDFANQKLLPYPGFYTVNRYPMQDALLKYGVSWKFYN